MIEKLQLGWSQGHEKTTGSKTLAVKGNLMDISISPQAKIQKI